MTGNFSTSYFMTFRLSVVALLAMMSARAVNAFIGGALHLRPSAIAEAPGVANAPAKTSRKSDVPTRALLERNIFGAEREDFAAEGHTIRPPRPRAGFDAHHCERTSLRSKLVGTVVSSDRTRSIAIFTNPTTQQPVALYEGEPLEAGRIVSIEWREVKIDHLGRCERSSLLDDTAAATTVAAVDVPTPPDAAPKTELGKGVVKLSEDKYEIPRAEIDNILSNLGAVATQARVVPSFQNGTINGFKLLSIRPNSLYSRIGVRDGDVVQRINGYELSSPEAALEIYSKLKDAQSISVDLIRRGKPQTLDYAIE